MLSNTVKELSASSLANINKTLTIKAGETKEDLTFAIIDDSEEGEDDEQYRLVKCWEMFYTILHVA